MTTAPWVTPLKLADCGCVLETGDEGRPLFVPCRLHWMATELLAACRAAHRTLCGCQTGTQCGAPSLFAIIRKAGVK